MRRTAVGGREQGTAKYAEGAKREATIGFKDERDKHRQIG